MAFLQSVLILLAISSIEAQKLHIGLYYESLCPDSIGFIANHLNPAYKDFKDYIDVTFVPFGKSISYNGGSSFWCQNGELECVGNTLQSCTLFALSGRPHLKMEYVACQMTFGAEPTGQECAERVGVSYAEVSQCYHGGFGTQLQLEAERITHKIARPYPNFVPTIVYNNVFDQTLLDRSIVDFKSVLCELLSNAAPACGTK